jgi:hypothetical protein
VGHDLAAARAVLDQRLLVKQKREMKLTVKQSDRPSMNCTKHKNEIFGLKKLLVAWCFVSAHGIFDLNVHTRSLRVTRMIHFPRLFFL